MNKYYVMYNGKPVRLNRKISKVVNNYLTKKFPSTTIEAFDVKPIKEEPYYKEDWESAFDTCREWFKSTDLYEDLSNIKVLFDTLLYKGLIQVDGKDFLSKILNTVELTTYSCLARKVEIIVIHVVKNPLYNKDISSILDIFWFCNFPNLFFKLCKFGFMDKLTSKDLYSIASYIGSNLPWEKQLAYYTIYRYLLTTLSTLKIREFQDELTKKLRYTYEFKTEQIAWTQISGMFPTKNI